MKWLLLLMSISCGKHYEPGAPVETTRETKNPAPATKIKPEQKSSGSIIKEFKVPNVTAQMKYWNGNKNEVIELKITQDIHQLVSELLTLNLSKIEPKKIKINIFTLAPSGKLPPLQSNSATFCDIDLRFNHFSQYPLKLHLKSRDQDSMQFDWSENMSLRLSAEVFSSLSRGEVRFGLEFENPESDIKGANYYRVFKSDGNQKSILFISKDIEFSALLSELKIEATDIDLVDLKNVVPAEMRRSWWKRKTTQGWVLGYFSIYELKTLYRAHNM